MNSARLYANWSKADYILHDKIVFDQDMGEEVFDPNFTLVGELENYLQKYGAKIRENHYHREHKDNIWTISSDVKTLAYRIENTTVFIRYVQHIDDWPSGENPDRETVTIRIYSRDNTNKIVQNITNLVPNISTEREPACLVLKRKKRIY